MIVTKNRSAVACLLCNVAILLTVGGCSGRPSNVAKKVSGKITVGGQPLAGAKVIFTPEKGNSSFGVTDAEGKYNLFWSQARGRGIEGAVIGENTVEISTFQPGNPAAKTPNDVAEKVPFKYREAAGRPKVTVKAGVNVIDIPLDAGPIEPPQPKGKSKGKGKGK